MPREMLIAVALLGATLTGGGGPASQADAAARRQAESIFSATGFSGGLVLHVGCGSGRLTAALGGSGRNVVQGLDADQARVAEARDHIRSLGLYGRVSAMCWDKPFLPCVDHLVNLLVVETPEPVPTAEIQRVLAPRGMAYVRRGDKWTKVAGSVREGVDEWTHYLHDASGNAVGHDTVVGPPRLLQWSAGPRHTRSHEYTPSFQALVSAGGRVFYIQDEGTVSDLQGAPDWQLMARDAYNGLLLWKRPVGNWFSHLAGWTQGPMQIQRRVVAVGDHVYVTLGYHGTLSALSAVTGETVREYAGTEGADEIICHRGVLVLAVKAVTDERRAELTKWQEMAKRRGSPLQERDSAAPLMKAFRKTENAAATSVRALDAETGKPLWQREGEEAAGLRPLSLRACGDHVYFHKNGGLFCLDLRTGATRWSKNSDQLRTVSEDALVCWSKKAVTLLSPQDGSVRWSQSPVLCAIRDVFLIGDSVWIGGFKPFDTGRKHTGPVWGPYFAVQRDLTTGELVKEVTAENPGHHHRCYSSKATDRYILGGRRGTEFLDLASGEYRWNSWARGTCRYGVMPANGFLYVPPHSCGCYITAKLTGFNALAPASSGPADRVGGATEASLRLEKGPAYGVLGPRPSTPTTPPEAAWPTYRADAQRSGVARCAVPFSLAPAWRIELGARTTAPTLADGKVFVACGNEHRLLAIAGATGETVWAFTTDGRVDSPPTIHEGQALVGCRDGSVYSLRAADGVLAWRFRQGGRQRCVTVQGQLESAAPVHGSVLVRDNVAVFTAGRSSYLDGGLRLYRLDPRSGKTLSETRIYSPDSETGRQPEQYNSNSMPGGRSDILVADDTRLYLRDLTFSKQGVAQKERAPHLFTLTDFLDDSWTHRSYWIFGTTSSIATGCSGRDRKLIYGRLLVFDDSTVYGYGRKTVHWSNEFQDGPYRVFARRRDADQPTWEAAVPIRVHAMLLAGDIVFAAGPAADKLDGEGGLLLALSAADGAELARYPLEGRPVFDGMAAAEGKLYLALGDGSLVCMAEKQDGSPPLFRRERR